MASPVKIKLACRNYDGTNAILRGLVRAPGVEFETIENNDVPAMFAGMFKGEYDVSEMSLAELIYYVSRNRADFIAIPVFPSRIFRHGFIFCRKSAGIEKPQDLSGKKIGFIRWVQTASIWMRGMLIDEYSVSAKDSAWYVASMHHWDDADPEGALTPRDGSAIQWIPGDEKDNSERACRALFDGRLDALGITEAQLALVQANSAVRRLFENSRTVEVDYFRRTRILPIMHVVALRNDVVDKYPELPVQLFHLFSEAKLWARRWRRSIPSLVEAWPQYHLDEEQEIFQTDPWAYGLEPNRHVLKKFLGYCHAHGVSATDIASEELFHPSSLDLVE
jgi:4,5-dihydroxyphthalate decarboxylase